MSKQFYFEGIYFSAKGNASSRRLFTHPHISDAIDFVRSNSLLSEVTVEFRTDTLAILSSAYTYGVYLIRFVADN